MPIREAVGDVTLVLKFGKHEGDTIEDCPTDYLEWLAENMENDAVRAAAQTELSYRQDHGESKPR